MDLTFSETETAFRDELRGWLAENPPSPEPTDGDEDTHYAWRRDWQRTLYDAGWAAPGWPAEYGGRYLRSAFTEEWAGRVDEIGSDDEAFAAIAASRAAGEGEAMPVYAGQAVGALATDRSAADVVADLARGLDLLGAAARRWRART